jgi:hypothetical protein
MKFLETGQDVARELRRIFRAERGRRIAVVGFVGSRAEAYLPRPKGIELVCWNRVPGTNPVALRRLKKLGVQVSFAKNLHMKVYWTQHCGAIVASANLSTNAFGSGDLQEAGVLLSSAAVPIQKILQSVRPRPATDADIKRLERENEKHKMRRPAPPPRPNKTFQDWLDTPFHRKWVLFCCDGTGRVLPSKRLRKVAKRYRAGGKIENYGECRRGEVRPPEYLLVVSMINNYPAKARWMFADHVVLVNKKDRAYHKNYPYQVAQFHPLVNYRAVPFRIDGAFRKALRSAHRDLGADAEEEFSSQKAKYPTQRLLRLLGQHYDAASEGGES